MTGHLFWLICYPLIASAFCRQRASIQKKVDCDKYNKLQIGAILACAGDKRCIWQSQKDAFPLDDPRLFSAIEFSPQESQIDQQPPKFPKRQKFDPQAYAQLKTMTETQYAEGLAVYTIDADGVAYRLKVNEHYLKKFLKVELSHPKLEVVPDKSQLKVEVVNKQEKKVQHKQQGTQHTKHELGPQTVKLHTKTHPNIEEPPTNQQQSVLATGSGKGKRRRMVWTDFPAVHVPGQPEQEMGVIENVPAGVTAVASVYKHVRVDMGMFGAIDTNSLITSAHNLYRSIAPGNGVWFPVRDVAWGPQLQAPAGAGYHIVRAFILRGWHDRGSDDYDLGAILMTGPAHAAPLTLGGSGTFGGNGVNAYVTAFNQIFTTMRHDAFTMDCVHLSCESNNLAVYNGNCGSPVVTPGNHRLMGAMIVAEKANGDAVFAKMTNLRRMIFDELSNPRQVMGQNPAHLSEYGGYIETNDYGYDGVREGYDVGREVERVIYGRNEAETAVIIDLERSIQHFQLVHSILFVFAILFLATICCGLYVVMGGIVGLKVADIVGDRCNYNKNDNFIGDCEDSVI